MKIVDIRDVDLDSMDTLMGIRAEHPEPEVEMLVTHEQYWATIRRIETFTHSPLPVGKDLRWAGMTLRPHARS